LSNIPSYTEDFIVITYAVNGTYQPGFSISSLLVQAQLHGGGAAPTLQHQNTVLIAQGQYQIVTLTAQMTTYIAIPLLTCAAVLISSTDAHALPRAILYHAPSGTLPAGIVQQARADLGTPPWASMVAIYAFPKPSDKNYVADALTLEQQGIPANSVVFMPNLPGSSFGINTHGLIGI
jgi:hypothetical protein